MHDSFVIFTNEEGGLYHVRRSTREKYDLARQTGFWHDWQVDDTSISYELAYIAFAPVEIDFDFVSGETRLSVVR